MCYCTIESQEPSKDSAIAEIVVTKCQEVLKNLHSLGFNGLQILSSD